MYNTARDNLCNLIESSAEIVHRLTKKESILGKRKFNSLAPDNDVSNKVIQTVYIIQIICINYLTL